MAKFKIKLTLKELGVEIEGDRQDAHLISHNLSHQVAGLLEPATKIVEGEIIDEVSAKDTPVAGPIQTQRKKKRATGPNSSPGQANTAEAVNWRHNPGDWGNPKQAWSSAQKAIWLLYVISKQANISEMSIPQIAATFNKHFKQAGLIRNLPRDLGNLKTNKTPSWIGEDATKHPSSWFLTEEGIKQASQLVIEAKGASPVT